MLPVINRWCDIWKWFHKVRVLWFLNIVSVLLAIMLDAFVRPAEGTAAGSIQLLACRSPPKTETAADEWNCNRIGGTTNQRQKEQATAIATAIIADPHPRLPFLLKLTSRVRGSRFSDHSSLFIRSGRHDDWCITACVSCRAPKTLQRNAIHIRRVLSAAAAAECTNNSPRDFVQVWTAAQPSAYCRTVHISIYSWTSTARLSFAVYCCYRLSWWLHS